MASKQMTSTKCPSNELSLTNCAIINPQDFTHDPHYIRFYNRGHLFMFKCLKDEQVAPNCIGFSMVQRRWANLGLNMQLNVEVYRPTKDDILEEVHFEIDFFKAKDSTGKAIDTDALAIDFHRNFENFLFVNGEKLVILFDSKHFSISVSEVRSKGKGTVHGILTKNTKIVYHSAENSPICLKGMFIFLLIFC